MPLFGRSETRESGVVSLHPFPEAHSLLSQSWGVQAVVTRGRSATMGKLVNLGEQRLRVRTRVSV